MKTTPAVRWIFFLLLGLPVQLLVYILYPLLWAYWRLFIFRKADKALPSHWEPDFEVGRATKLDGALLDNDDDHGALTQYGFIGKRGMELLLDSEGNFARAIDRNKSLNMRYVSGDCVGAWAFAYSLIPDSERPRAAASKAAWNYLKYLGSRAWDEVNNGDVSNRCNNFGVNWCPDSDVLKLGQPAAGPQFYTSSALLAVAYNESFSMKVVFWLHWLILGGWYWAWWPAIYPKNDLWYVRDITMKCLWTHREMFGDRWWIRMPMKKINETTVFRNDLFEAMVGNAPGEMPEVMHAFFSQERDAASGRNLYQQSNRASAFIKPAIYLIAQKAKTSK